MDFQKYDGLILKKKSPLKKVKSSFKKYYHYYNDYLKIWPLETNKKERINKEYLNEIV